MIDLTSLNPMQRLAVENTEGPLLVLAGAGSGKTRVLTYRVAHLMENGVPAWKILAITFTNKAAKEMKERVLALAGSAAEDCWISTFHACCAKILRRDIEKLGYKRSFTIYDEDDRNAVIKQCMKALEMDEKQYPPRMLKSVISDAKNRLLSPEEWFQESDKTFREKKMMEAFQRYESTLKDNNALDFDDLLVKTLQLMADNPPVLQYYQDKFSYILVDEYQDTNAAQYELVKLLASRSRNLCVVGDDDQSIYGWRGADIRNILDFEKDFADAKVVKLEQNYRSTGNILDAANQVIAHNTGRKEKALWTEAGEGERLGVYRALDERDEAAFIAQMSAKIVREGEKPGEIAVLYRTNSQSRVLEEAFVRAGIPYRVYGGTKFYDRKEVKDLIAYMRVLVNPDDDVSCRRVINEPKRAIGDSTVETLLAYARENEMSLMTAALSCDDAGLPARAKTAVAGFGEMMVELTEQLYESAPDKFLETLIEKTGYVEALKKSKDEEAQNRIENIQELQGAVAEFMRLNPEGSVADFLENVALVTDMDSMEESRGSVTLMTLHAAKGLEFNCVFLAGMEDGVFPLSRAMTEPDQMEEERRLCYVGITRARKRLFLSCAASRMLYNNRTSNPPSQFLSEIPPRLIRGAMARQSAPTRLPPPSGRSVRETGWSAPRPAARQTAEEDRPPWEEPKAAKSALNIPGLQKGFGSAPAREVKAVSLFRPGDRVSHRIFGKGTVSEVFGDGAAQKVRVQFEGRGEKLFAANAAPLTKINE